MGAEPSQNIPGQLATMGAGLDDFERRFVCSRLRVTCPVLAFKPVSKLEREQLTKEFADADAGEKVTVFSNIVLFFFIKSTIGTIQREVHKAGEWNGSLSPYDGPDFIDDFAQRLSVVRI